MLVEEILQAAAQSIGYAGFLWFILRFPQNKRQPQWQVAERSTPLVALAFFVIQASVYLNAFGVHTQGMVTLWIALGFVFYAFILFVLINRIRSQTELDRPRLQWVFCGCAIGMPPILLGQAIAIVAPSSLEGVVYLLNALSAVLPLTMYYAVRRYRVMDVTFVVTRRITLLLTWFIFGVLFALLAEALILRVRAFGVVWGAEIVAVVLASIFFESVHEGMNRVADRVLFPTFHRAARAFRTAAAKFASEANFDEISRVITETPFKELRLASAAVFIADSSHGFVRRAQSGWSVHCTSLLEPNDSVVRQALDKCRIRIDEGAQQSFPGGKGVPVAGIALLDNGIPAGVAYYSGHDDGSLISTDEYDILSELVEAAAEAYGRARRRALQSEITELRKRLGEAPGV